MDAFVIESITQLLKILSDFGAADVDWGTREWHSDYAVAVTFFGDVTHMPRYRARLTALGRYGIRAILAGEGHIARIAGDLAAEGAATLLDVLPYYDPDAFSAEVTGWLAGRDQTSTVTEVLEAAAGADPERAVRRVIAITILTLARPDNALEILRDMASRGPDGSRHVAAAVLANLGEVLALYPETTSHGCSWTCSPPCASTTWGEHDPSRAGSHRRTPTTCGAAATRPSPTPWKRGGRDTGQRQSPGEAAAQDRVQGTRSQSHRSDRRRTTDALGMTARAASENLDELVAAGITEGGSFFSGI